MERLKKQVRDKGKQETTVEEYDCGTGGTGTGERSNDTKVKQ